MIKNIVILALVVLNKFNGSAQGQKVGPNAVRVNKCCEKFEVLLEERCVEAKLTNKSVWVPEFTGRNGAQNVKVPEVKFIIGIPDCGTMQKWPIYHYNTSSDKLILFSDGKLRHVIKDLESEHLDDDPFIEDLHNPAPYQYDYEQGRYCMDLAVSVDNKEAQYALVCSPHQTESWTDPDFMLRKIINPVCHGLSMIVLLIVAIIYFVLPTLRDLVGNIVTTITMCLIVSQAADLVRIFTEYSSHVSFFVADTVFYVSLLGAFFWLNSMGYYIWKTFRSRNVFLRVTDGRKYCWYSGYAWGATALMAGVAIFAHFFLDSVPSKMRSVFQDQETIGTLGIAVFFTPIAFLIIINIFFYVTTLKVMNRMNTYGRIHHKLKCNFIMFSLMFIVMTISWLFLIMTWLHNDGLLYTHIIVNAFQAPCILYICVLRQKHVTFLLKKSCCYNEPPAATDWGDELTYMNGGDY